MGATLSKRKEPRTASIHSHKSRNTSKMSYSRQTGLKRGTLKCCCCCWFDDGWKCAITNILLANHFHGFHTLTPTPPPPPIDKSSCRNQISVRNNVQCMKKYVWTVWGYWYITNPIDKSRLYNSKIRQFRWRISPENLGTSKLWILNSGLWTIQCHT